MLKVIILVVMIFSVAVSNLFGDQMKPGFSSLARRINDLNIIVEVINEKEGLIIYKQNGMEKEKLVEIKEVTRSHRPLLIDGLLQDNDLALVFDIGGLLLAYVKFEKVDGIWNLVLERNFSVMNTVRFQKSCLIKLTQIDKVRMTFIKENEDFYSIRPDGTYREEGKIELNDPYNEYLFKPDGSILKDGKPYDFKKIHRERIYGEDEYNE